MMQIKLPKEIMTYSEELWQGFNVRELLCIAGAVVASLIAYMLTKLISGNGSAVISCTIASVPFGLLGFFKYNGLTFERFIWQLIKTKFLLPKKRKYVSENFHEILNTMEDVK